MATLERQSRSKPQGEGRLPLSKQGCENRPVMGSTQMVILWPKIMHQKMFRYAQILANGSISK